MFYSVVQMLEKICDLGFVTSVLLFLLFSPPLNTIDFFLLPEK